MTPANEATRRCPYLCVALDHGSSFDNWLRRWDAPIDARVLVKQGLLRLCLETGVDGVIIGSDLALDLDSVVRQAAAYGAEVWLGLPDQTVDVGGRLVGHATEASAWAAAAGGAMGVKVGLSVDASASWSEAEAHLDRTASTILGLGLHLVVEPYFRPEDDERIRRRFLNSLGQMPFVRFAKLEVHEPSRWSPVYASSGLPWVARSEGLSFDAYLAHLNASKPFGCVGTMVGGAAWGIEQGPVLSSEYVSEFRRRIDQLRRVLVAPAVHCG